ncbi:MAG: CHAD domain-containing protein [Blastocatellia bacterium]|nr:CHAD domain-containing protein [Blastocatellia bacterium]
MVDPPQVADISTGQFAKQVLTGLYSTILAQERGALAGEVVAIHDMRVATRRLRVALSNFAITLSREDRLRIQSHLKNLAEALGNVRDFDVLIETLEDALRADPGNEAIKSIIGRLRSRRRHRQRRLATYLAGEDFASFKHEDTLLGVDVLPLSQTNEMKKHGQAA